MMILSEEDSRKISIVDSKSLKEVSSISIEAPCKSIYYHKESDQIYASLSNGKIIVWKQGEEQSFIENNVTVLSFITHHNSNK